MKTMKTMKKNSTKRTAPQTKAMKKTIKAAGGKKRAPMKRPAAKSTTTTMKSPAAKANSAKESVTSNATNDSSIWRFVNTPGAPGQGVWISARDATGAVETCQRVKVTSAPLA